MSVQKPRKFSTDAAHHQGGGMAHAWEPTSRVMSGAKFGSLLAAAEELA